MRKTKISELFPYENVVNEKTLKAKVLVWNNRTMLIAEENSALFSKEELSFDDIIQGVFSADVVCINILLYSALANANDNYDFEEFLDYYDEGDLPEYTRAVVDGLMNYLPDKELQESITEMNNALSKGGPEADEESDHWAFYFYFCKKYFSMSDNDFLNSTWRTISILLWEHLKNHPDYQKEKIVSAEFVDI